MVCNEGEHNYHFVDLESPREHYTENDVCKTRPRVKRIARFVCDKCGLINRVEVTHG